jgi:dipeptidyl aminopeptidase/acylaminoacyl peptidase
MSHSIFQHYKDFFKEGKCIAIFTVRYQVNDHWVNGFVVIPQGKIQKMPCIIYNRGGSFAFGEIDDHILDVHITKLASLGYVVIASQYSGNGGSEGNDEVGGRDVDDVLVLKECLEEVREADVERIGMMGYSRGGMMTYLAIKKSDWIKAAVVIGAMTDLDLMERFRPEIKSIFQKAFGNSQKERRERSAVYFAEKLKHVPVLVMHGSADDRVPLEDAQNMIKMLEKEQVPHRSLIWEKGDHMLRKYYDAYWEEVKKWFSTYV